MKQEQKDSRRQTPSRDEAKRYDARTYGSLGYDLAHGTYLDLRLWRPQSVTWKNRIRSFKRFTGTDIYPVADPEKWRERSKIVDIPYLLEIRVETPGRLVQIFLSDAEKRELDLGRDPHDEARVKKRARQQLCKYLLKLSNKSYT